MCRIGREKKKWASDLHRTATTAYPCSGQGLGDSAGAGRIGLARRKGSTFRANISVCLRVVIVFLQHIIYNQ